MLFELNMFAGLTLVGPVCEVLHSTVSHKPNVLLCCSEVMKYVVSALFLSVLMCYQHLVTCL